MSFPGGAAKSCWMRVDHGSGWQTSYYHLRNARSAGGVNQNDQLGTIACETCAGGFATGPHVHFSLLYNGAYTDVDGLVLSGWQVHTGNGSYGSGYIERNSERKDAGAGVYNDGTGSSDPIPPAPSNVQASDGTYNDKIQVTWSSVSGATRYDVYRATSLDGSKTQFGNKTGTAWDDIDTTPGTTYYYWVTACNDVGCSNDEGHWGGPDTGYRAALNQPPRFPDNPSPSNGATSVSINPQLQWSGGDPDGDNTVAYDVYLDITNPPTHQVADNLSSLSYSPSALDYETHYYWKIVATDDHGLSSASSVWNFQTETAPVCHPATVPPTPTVIAPVNSDNLPLDAASLRWVDVPDEYCLDYYNINVHEDGGETVDTGWVGHSPYVVPEAKLTAGKHYTWHVWAHNSLGFGEGSAGSFWAGAPPAATYAVEFYLDPYYMNGYCFINTERQGNVSSSCTGYDNQITSMLLKPGWSIRLFDEPGQQGASRCFTASEDAFQYETFDGIGSPLDDAVSSYALYHQSICPSTIPPPPQMSRRRTAPTATRSASRGMPPQAPPTMTCTAPRPLVAPRASSPIKRAHRGTIPRPRWARSIAIG